MSLDEEGVRVRDGDLLEGDDVGLVVVGHAVVNRADAGADVEAGDLVAVDPDDAAVVHPGADAQGGEFGPDADGEHAPEKHRRVVVQHVVEQGVVVVVGEADRGLAGGPGGVLDEAEGAPGVDGRGGLAGALAVAPGDVVGRHVNLGLARVNGLAGGAPGAGEGVVEAGVDELHGGAVAARGGGPGETRAVGHAVHDEVGGVAQAHAFAFVAEFAGPGAEGREAPPGGEFFRRAGEDEVAVRGEGGAGGKNVVDAGVEPPAGEIDGRVAGVVELDELGRVGGSARGVVELVDDDRGALRVGEGGERERAEAGEDARGEKPPEGADAERFSGLWGEAGGG